MKQLISSCHTNSNLKLSALYYALYPATDKVLWRDTVWECLSFPKHAFILWLAAHDRLLTQDKLLKRGIININQCKLCSDAVLECRNHLFFDCSFSRDVWNGIMDWIHFKWRSCDWCILLNWYNTRLKGNGLKHKVKRMVLAATVYSVWRERNARIFGQISKSVEQLIRDIKIDVLSIILNSDHSEDFKLLKQVL
ncbi:uncharacterized protein LOC109842187 [Asparagus officinalis]|uniref:uncharacterized protein LOC109842187 n=1 Tax=Asparagus officinalis TaxID=4686 RepID=UPI00098E5EFA|nr:uncharacterized protein LOC109842187 [Asparagus officinalis]